MAYDKIKYELATKRTLAFPSLLIVSCLKVIYVTFTKHEDLTYSNYGSFKKKEIFFLIQCE